MDRFFETSIQNISMRFNSHLYHCYLDTNGYRLRQSNKTQGKVYFTLSVEFKITWLVGYNWYISIVSFFFFFSFSLLYKYSTHAPTHTSQVPNQPDNNWWSILIILVEKNMPYHWTINGMTQINCINHKWGSPTQCL